MNRKTLQKVIDAIKEDKKDYAMGILDTLIDTLPEEKLNPIMSMSKDSQVVKSELGGIFSVPVQDEGQAIEMAAKAKMHNIDMSAIKTEN